MLKFYDKKYINRKEKRRGGEEGRIRGAADHLKKKKVDKVVCLRNENE